MVHLLSGRSVCCGPATVTAAAAQRGCQFTACTFLPRLGYPLVHCRHCGASVTTLLRLDARCAAVTEAAGHHSASEIG